MKSIVATLFLALSFCFCIPLCWADTEESLRMVAYDGALPLKIRYQAAKQLLEQVPDNSEYLLLLGNLSRLKFDYSTALKAYDSLYVSHFQELKDAQKCQFLYDYGQVLTFFNDRKAVVISKELLNLEKPDSLKRFDFDAYLILYAIGGRTQKNGYKAWSQGKLNEIYKTLERKHLLSPLQQKSYKGCLHKIRMSQFIEEHKLDSAIKESKLVLACATTSSDSASAAVSIADIYKRMNRYDIAESHYLHVINDLEFSFNTPVAILNYLSMLQDLGRYEDALDICDKVGDSVLDTEVNEWITYFYYCKGKALTMTGRLQEGAQYLEKGYLGMYELYQNASMTFESLSELEIDEMMSHNMADKNTARQRGWLIIVLSFLLATAIYGGYFSWRRWRSSKAEVAEMKERYSADFQRFDAQHRELTSLSLQLARLQTTVDDAKKSLATDTTDPEKAYGILRDASSQADSWNSFKLYFEGCHPNFMKNLYERHPQLSENDVRACVYMLMNFTTKEIAALTNRSVRTIESQKYRLSKKMNLGSDTSILEYLRSLA